MSGPRKVLGGGMAGGFDGRTLPSLMWQVNTIAQKEEIDHNKVMRRKDTNPQP